MVTVTAESTGLTTVRMSNGRHEWLADEPLDLGTDSAPNPYDLLLAALASCTCITISLYCKHKNIELRKVSVTCEHDRVHAHDCEECDDDTSGFVDRIHSQVEIDAELTEHQKERLTQIAVRCPVHKTLQSNIAFRDAMSFDSA